MSVVPIRKPRETPAPIPSVATLGESAQETALRRSISIHCPNQDIMTMGARVAIAKLRDRASIGMARACEPARVLLAQASGLAAMWVYAPSDFRTLSRVGAAIAQTVEAAVAIERAVGGQSND